jgi:asparagine synthase (glutamine-hydrolysing)
MIGLLHDWHAPAAEAAAVRRFVAAIGAGLPRPVSCHHAESATLAGVALTRCDPQRWRAWPIGGGGWLAFTGFIGNLDALRRDLDRPRADAAELYAAGYSRWGDAIDLRALGEFAAIIVWPGERRVRAVRSPILAPPLHLWRDSRRAVIASTARAVLAAADLPAEVDERKIADSLCLDYTHGTRGWYKGIHRLEPGTRVWLTRGGMRTDRYYDLFQVAAVQLKRDSDYVEAASALLAEGTRAVLSGCERPAVSLSGGLDSQAVAVNALAARPGERLLGLTSVPEAGLEPRERRHSFDDERHHVAALAAMYPLLDSALTDSADTTFDHRLMALFMMGGIAPRNVLNLPWLHSIHERARSAGCDVLLTGAMGNLGFSFGGRGAFPSWLASGQWPTLWRELRAAKGGLARSFARDAVLPLLPASVQARLRRRDPAPVWSAIASDYVQAMAVQPRADAFHGLRSQNTRQYRAAMLAGAGNELGDLRQAFSAIHGLPMRDPTAYRPLLEFCIGIPDDQFLRDGQSRWLARRMLRGVVPDMVVNETRRGRQAADAELKLGRERPALIDELDTLACDPAMASRLDLPGLRAALVAWQAGTPFTTTQNAILRLALPRAISTARFIRYVEGANG